MSQSRPRGERDIRIILRCEGALVATGGLWAYAQIEAGWLMFAALLLLPDLSFLGYLSGRTAGVYCYNFAHTYLSPVVVYAILALAGVDLAEELALIWIVHIGADRLLGYGLKLQTDYKKTHLSG